jgi:hypothetical protein
MNRDFISLLNQPCSVDALYRQDSVAQQLYNCMQKYLLEAARVTSFVIPDFFSCSSAAAKAA